MHLIGKVRTVAGLGVKTKLDKRSYPTGVQIDKAQLEALSLTRDGSQRDWNYALHPHATGSTRT